MAWVTASFGGIFFSSLFGYKTGDISAAHTLTLIIFSVLGYAAAHFTQYRIGRSLEMTQD
jgi:F0F1-type ATP synthase assembly protein I